MYPVKIFGGGGQRVKIGGLAFPQAPHGPPMYTIYKNFKFALLWYEYSLLAYCTV